MLYCVVDIAVKSKLVRTTVKWVGRGGVWLHGAKGHYMPMTVHCPDVIDAVILGGIRKTTTKNGILLISLQFGVLVLPFLGLRGTRGLLGIRGGGSGSTKPCMWGRYVPVPQFAPVHRASFFFYMTPILCPRFLPFFFFFLVKPGPLQRCVSMQQRRVCASRLSISRSCGI